MTSSSMTRPDHSDAVARYRSLCSEALLLPPGQQAQFLLDLSRKIAAEECGIVPIDAKIAAAVSQDTATPATPKMTQFAEFMEEPRESASSGATSTTSASSYQCFQCISSISPKRHAARQSSTPPAKRQQVTPAPHHGIETGQDIGKAANALRKQSFCVQRNPRTSSTIPTDPMSINAVLERNTRSPG